MRRIRIARESTTKGNEWGARAPPLRARLGEPPTIFAPASKLPPDAVEAIASLFDEGLADPPRRVWKLPTFPMKASWTTLKDNPALEPKIDAEGKRKTEIVYQTEGDVFQAEELLVDGRWECFYGFVGPYHLAKVPAAEIKFPTDTPPPR